MPRLTEKQYIEFVEEIHDEAESLYDHYEDDGLGNDLYDDEEDAA